MATTASSDAAEGPVMGLINKRLRALRKKFNRITQMEESISQGKTLNKEQEEVLRSKPAVVILTEELEKLRAPLSAAVTEEISLATKHHQSSSSSSSAQTTTAAEDVTDLPPKEAAGDDGDSKLEDLMKFLYFGSLFDVKSQNEFTSIMFAKTHERGCCLTYDCVTDDATDVLGDRDLDLMSQLWNLMISRPVDSTLPHKNALESCIKHAKLWLANSEQPLESNCNVSYALLREKLNKIMASDYLTTTPSSPVELAAAAGNYAYQQKEEDASNRSNSNEQESVVNDKSLQDEHQKVESVTEGEVVSEQQEEGYTQVGAGNAKRDYAPRGYQNQRGHRGARRGGGGYQNGRGGRGGGGGGHRNGRYESYDNSGGNGYQKSYYNNRGRGRGGGGGGNGHAYNHHQDSNVSAAS